MVRMINTKKKYLYFLILISSFISCNNDISTNINGQKNIAISGSIKLDEIFRNKKIDIKTLKIKTINSQTSIAPDGSFNLKIDAEKSFFIYLTDSLAQIHAISFVSKNNDQPYIIPIGIESTLLSLIRLTPGILSKNLDSTEVILNQIKLLDSYYKFKTDFKELFYGKNLQEILKNNIFYYDFIAIINEYFQKYKSVISTNHVLFKIKSNRQEKNQFEVVKFPKENILSNYGWRFVKVWRTDIFKNSSKDTLLSDPMCGAQGFSLTSLYNWTWNHGTRISDKGYNETDNLLLSKYHVYGPGYKPSEENINVSINSDKVWAYSIGYYLALPLFDILSGIKIDNGINLIINITNTLWESENLYSDIEKLKLESNDQNKAQLLQDLTIMFITRLAAIFDVNLSWLLTPISAANMFGYIYTIKNLQPYCTFTIYKKSSTKSIIAYYPFNGNANDESGFGNNGVVHGAFLTSDRFGRANSAYHFDGYNDYLEIPNAVINDLPEGSFSAWIKLDELNRQNAIIDKTETYATNYLQIIVHSNNRLRVNIDVHYGESLRLYSNTVFNKNTWYHVVVTWDGNYWEIYINGHLDSQAERNRTVPNKYRKVLIGKVDNNTAFMKGTIDDIRIYNYVLSDSEINNLYHENGW